MKERIEWIDWLKGIALVLVIIGHTFRTSMYSENMIYGYIKSFIYAFHMPLFISISGFLFQSNRNNYMNINILDFFRNKWKSYMKPLISYAAIMYIIFSIFSIISGFKIMLGGGIGLTEYFLLTITGENPYSVHLWYLLTTFLIVITCYVVLKISSKTHHDEMFVLFILAFVLWNIRILWGEDFCMTVKSYLKYSIFFVLGMILNKKRIDVPQKYYLLLSFISWVYIFIYSTDMIKTTMFLYSYLKNALVLISCFVIIINFFDVARSDFFHSKFIKYLGKNSMVFYLFHQPFCAMLGIVLFEKIGLPGYSVCLLCFLGSIILPELVIRASKKNLFVKAALSGLFNIKV